MPCNLHPVFGVHVCEKFLEGCVIRIAYLPSFRRSSAGTTKSASGDEDEGGKELEHRLPRHHGHHDHHQPDHHDHGHLGHHDHRHHGHHDHCGLHNLGDHGDPDEEHLQQILHKRQFCRNTAVATECTRVYYLSQRIYSSRIIIMSFDKHIIWACLWTNAGGEVSGPK